MSSLKPVSQIIYERYGIHADPGDRTDCPECERHTFSITCEDTMGRCWHPDCLKVITRTSEQITASSLLANELSELLNQWKKGLHTSNNKDAHAALDYLVTDRHITPEVISTHSIGVVPEDLSCIVECCERVQEKLQKYLSEKELDRELSKLKEYRETMMKTFDKGKRWICFFYFNQNLRITAVRLRKPKSKSMMMFKLGGSMGVFGHDVFDTPEKGRLVDKMILVEGEFNLLAAQTVNYNQLKSIGKEYQPLPIVAVGSATYPAVKVVRSICRLPIVCYDNDDAGWKVADKMLHETSITAFTTPERDSDLDSFIQSFGGDFAQAWTRTQDLISGRRFYGRHFKSVAEEIAQFRDSKSAKMHRTNTASADLLRDDLADRSQILTDGFDVFTFGKETRSLVRISPESSDYVNLIYKYGINPKDSLFDFITADLIVSGREKGILTEVHKLAFYDSETNTVYLFNHKDTVYKITPNSIEKVKNGTDGILFVPVEGTEPFEIDLELNTANKSLLDEHLLSAIQFEDAGTKNGFKKLCILIWILALFFPQLHVTKAILAFIGPKGAAKSFILKLIGKLIFGKLFNVTAVPSKEDDFDAAITNSYFVGLDNADTARAWLPDKLAVMATGGTIKRRDLYTTNKMVDFEVQAFAGITSRTPKFKRDDVNDRLIPIKVKRRKKFAPESKLIGAVLKHRNQIMTEIASHIQDVTKALELYKDDNSEYSFRIADFADFAMKIGKWSGLEKEVTQALDELSLDQTLFTLDDHPVMTLLADWIEENHEKEIFSADLHSELTSMAFKKKVNYPCQSSQALGQIITNHMAELEKLYVVEDERRHSNKRTLKFTMKTGKPNA